MEALYREKPGDLLVIFVHVLEEYPVGPHAQPTVDPLGSRGALVGIQFLQWFLDALKTILGLLGYGTAQVQDPTAADRCRFRHFGGG